MAFTKLADADDFVTAMVVDPRVGCQTRKMKHGFVPFTHDVRKQFLQIMADSINGKYTWEEAWKELTKIKEVREHANMVSWLSEACVKNHVIM